MRRLTKPWLVLPVLVALAYLATPSPASAEFILILSETGGPSQTIVDNGAGDSDPAAGRIHFSGTFGDFIADTVVSGSSNRLTGGPNAHLHIDELASRNTASGSRTLTVTLSDTDFNFPGTSGTPVQLNSTVGGSFVNSAAGDTLTFQSYVDTLNRNAPNGTSGSSVITTGPQTFTSTGGTTVPISGNATPVGYLNVIPYSISNVGTATLASGAELSITGDTTVTAIPEPTGLALGLGGLCLAGLGGWLRTRRKVV